MRSNRLPRGRAPRAVFSSLVSLALLMAVSAVYASDSFMGTWSSLYPASTSENVAGCQICHAASTQNLNPYGRDFCLEPGTVSERLQAIQDQDSDLDPTGSGNVTEIETNGLVLLIINTVDS